MVKNVWSSMMFLIQSVLSWNSISQCSPPLQRSKLYIKSNFWRITKFLIFEGIKVYKTWWWDAENSLPILHLRASFVKGFWRHQKHFISYVTCELIRSSCIWKFTLVWIIECKTSVPWERLMYILIHKNTHA